MKKVIALGLAAIFSASTMYADQQNWNTANTFLHFETPFQTASPERVALFNTEDLRTKHRTSHNGDVQFVVFGNQNADQSGAAAYYMPGGTETLTFNASFDANNEGTDTATILWSGAQGGVTEAKLSNTAAAGVIGAGIASGTTYTPFTLTGTVGTTPGLLEYVDTDPKNAAITTGAAGTAGAFVVGTSATTSSAFDLTTLSGLIDDQNGVIGDFVVDANKNIGVIRPWNFGIGYAPNVQMGSPISESAFVSTITPELKRSFWAIGATWKQLLSDNLDKGFFLELSTVLQGITMNMELNEINPVQLALVYDSSENTPGSPLTDWLASWGYNSESGLPSSDQGYNFGNSVFPTTVTEAFAQEAWNYGRVDGAQSVTRLADIELKLGYQFVCEENVMSNMFAGIVIPTGNKAKAEYLAEPIVGNGFHFAIMLGGTQEIQLDMGTKTRWSARNDTSFRYLFQNTQVRSFDTMSNGQWSRYMMVWPSYEAEQANGELLSADPGALRQYTPGINVFTADMHVTPRAQARMNQAIVVEHGSFKGEFGWNMMVRQAEEVELVNDWVDNKVAFVDASNNGTSLFNQTRTIYNDSYQSTPLTNNGAGGAGIADASIDQYNFASVKSTDLNLESAASPAIYTNTPYLAIGYAFNEEKSSVFSLGASYEISATNGYINDWTLWGKFGFTF
jgi:hypothetical protein